MATVAFNLRLDTQRDADLISWLDLLVASGENKSDFARDAMRRAMRDDVTLTDVMKANADMMREVQAVKDLIERGVVVASGNGTGADARADDDEVAQDILDNLDAIGA